MKFCKNCGTQLSKEVNFCRNCGEKVAPKHSIEAEIMSNNNPGSYRKRKPLSTPVKAGIIAIGIMIGGLMGAHLYFTERTKPVNTVENFIKVVTEGNNKELAAIMNSGQDQHKVSEKEAESFREYLTKDNDFTDLAQELQTQAERLETSNSLVPVADYNGNDIATLKKVGKKYFFYDDYKLVFFPFEVKASSNLDNIAIWIDGKKSTHLKRGNGKESIAYVFPGTHVIKGKYNDEYQTLETEMKIEFEKAFDNSLEVFLGFDSTQVVVYSNFDDAILFVNGESTGKEIGDIEKFGPVPTDGSVTLHAERVVEGNPIKSEPYKVTDDSTAELLFKVENTAPETAALEYLKTIEDADIAKFMDSYFSSMVDAINSRNVTSYEFIFDPEGKALEEFKSYLTNTIQKKGITEEYLGMKLVDYEKTEDGYQVTTNEEFNIYFGDGTGKRKEFESVFQVSLLEDGLKMHSLLKTNEILSEDLN